MRNGHPEPYPDTSKIAALYLSVLAGIWLGIGVLFVGVALDSAPRTSAQFTSTTSTVVFFLGFGVTCLSILAANAMAYSRSDCWAEYWLLTTKLVFFVRVRDAGRQLGWSRRATATYVITVVAGYVACLVGALIVA